MDSMYGGYSIQAQGLPGVGGPTGRPGPAGKSDSMEPKDETEGTGHRVQDESTQPNPENETVVSPGVVIVSPNDKEDGSQA